MWKIYSATCDSTLNKCYCSIYTYMFAASPPSPPPVFACQRKVRSCIMLQIQFFLLEISFRQLRLCYFVAPSLTRRRVCNLLYNCLWAFPEQSVLGRSPTQLTAILLSHLRLSQPVGPGRRIYIPI
jgi:hypothetical protein